MLFNAAEREPPLFALGSIVVGYTICNNDAPRLKPNSDIKWSDDFHEFIGKTLVKEPKGRLAARELSKLPWMQQLHNPSCDSPSIAARKGLLALYSRDNRYLKKMQLPVKDGRNRVARLFAKNSEFDAEMAKLNAAEQSRSNLSFVSKFSIKN